MNGSKQGGMGMIPPQAWLYIIGVPIVVGGVYFLVARPLMKKLNILQDKEDKELSKINDLMKKQPFWNGSWYKTNGGATLSDQDASMFAQKLIKAMGSTSGWYNPYSWGTDEEVIYGVFRSLGSKGNISKVVEAYAIKSNFRDLYTDLESELDNEDLSQVAQKISVYGS